ncbi:hypothetical protein [Legionella brunensis]|uniref:Uncharacterized protein n=1 Tax=Legionella brunensis TaxID=29422 RepID=A0A0W0STY4_9GAMM|nr:hypothetical protein [Legionella brunensis]KTC86716.1 hypothetical protein Lbru_0657 [Legionella brunensis]
MVNPFKKKPPEPPKTFSESVMRQQTALNTQNNEAQIANQKHLKKALYNEKTNKESAQLWEQVDKNCQELLDGKSEAYYQWETGMNRIANHLKVFQEALAKWTGNTDLPNPFWDKTKKDVLNVKPQVSYHVAMDDTGQIKSQAVVNGQPVGGRDQRLFDMALFSWADKNNYRLQRIPNDPEGRFSLTHKTTGQVLSDKTVFDNLKKDPTKGLHSHLSDMHALKLEENDSFRPTGP